VPHQQWECITFSEGTTSQGDWMPWQHRLIFLLWLFHWCG